ncbi:MAG: ABC transporter substrate-binding protein, partial [Blastocatellia bacterium]
MRGKLQLLILFLLACLLSSCFSSTDPSSGQQTAARGGRLVLADRSSPKSFNALTVSDLVSLNINFFLMCSRLTEFDQEKQQYIPGLAESWQAGDGGKTITVRLRDGLKFSDGAPLTADE